MSAVIALGGLAAPEAINPLIDLLNTWPSDVVQGEQALKALVQIGTKQAWQAIGQIAINHSSAVIRNLAERTLQLKPPT